MKYIYILIMILFSSQLYSQSWDEIKTDPSYIYGEGWGSSVQEADKNALSDLIGKITVVVTGDFETTTEEIGKNEDFDIQSYTSSKVKTFSQATLYNTEKLIISNEPDAYVGRWMKRSEINRIFDARKGKIKEFIELGMRGEKDAKIDDALRYYYWAHTLLKSLQHPNEVKTMGEDGNEHTAMAWIPNRMNKIFDDIRIQPISKENELLKIRITFRGQPVSSIDYTYFDGMMWSNIYSAKDGIGVLELSPNSGTSNIQIKYEYEYRGEAHIDNEVENVLAVVHGSPFRSAYTNLNINNITSQQSSDAPLMALQQEARTTNSSSVYTVNNTKPATINSAINTKLIKEDNPAYSNIISKIVSAIRTRNNSGITELFTPEGYEMYNKLIRYGKAKILDDKNCQFFRNNDIVYGRSVQMSFSFNNGYKKAFVEDVVFKFNKDQKIESISFGLGDTAEENILNKGVWPQYARYILMEFLENYKTAYALKRLDYINNIFDDDAVIIVGNVAKTMTMSSYGDGMNSISNNEIVSYNKYDKDEYLKKLARCFASNEFINIRFSNNDVIKLGKGGELYGIQIKQDYYSSNYGDTGYLFLMVDINNPEQPLIKVRTWQPERDPNFGIIGPEFF